MVDVRVLVVAAHPCEDSLNHALADRACRGLRSAGHDVHLLDLYDEGYDPVMHESEWNDYLACTYDDAHQRTDAAHSRLVADAEALVFVYPTWWSSVPAMLKGWIERTLRPGLTFEVIDGRYRPRLDRLRHIVGITTYGSSRTYVRLVNDNGRRLLTRSLPVASTARPRTAWLGLYGIDTSTAAQRAAFLDRVERRMAALDRGRR